MFVGIYAKDVQQGDVVQRDGNPPVLVKRVEIRKAHIDVASVKLIINEEEEEVLTLFADDILGLVHRPRPEERDVLESVRLNVYQAGRMLGRQEVDPEMLKLKLKHLRKAIEVWELGEPTESVPKAAPMSTKVKAIRLDDPAGGC